MKRVIASLTLAFILTGIFAFIVVVPGFSKGELSLWFAVGHLALFFGAIFLGNLVLGSTRNRGDDV